MKNNGLSYACPCAPVFAGARGLAALEAGWKAFVFLCLGLYSSDCIVDKCRAGWIPSVENSWLDQPVLGAPWGVFVVVFVFLFLFVATPTTRAQRGCVPVLLKEAGARAAVALCRRPAGRYLRGPLYRPASQRDRGY